MIENIKTKEDSSDKMIPLINNSHDLITSKLNNSESSTLSGSNNGIENKDKTKDGQNKESRKRKKSFEKLKISDNNNFPKIDGILNLGENNNKRKSSCMKEAKSLLLEEENEESVKNSKKKEEIGNNLIIVKDNDKKKNKEEQKDELINERDYNIESAQINNDISNNISNLDGDLQKKQEKTNLIVKHPLMDKNSFPIKNFESQIIGFINIGNTCYMNSFLQILLHTPGFINELKKERKENNDDLIDNLINLSKNPYNEKYLKNIKAIMGKIKDSYEKKNNQSDSQEFGIDLINETINLIKGEQSFSDENKIEEEQITSKNIGTIKKSKFEEYIHKYYNENNEISLEKMFQFHESQIEIEHNENNEITKINKIKFEAFINIELNFLELKKTDLMDLLEIKYKDYLNIANDNTLTINDKNKHLNENKNLKKNIPKKNTNNKKTNQKSWKDKFIDFIKWIDCLGILRKCFKVENEQTEEQEDYNIEDIKENYINLKKLASLPKILIISIHRAFLKNDFNDKIISYKKSLDIKKFIDKDIIKKGSTKYQLYAVNECNAHKKEYGHYYSYIKINNKTWYKFDDNQVTKESPNLSSEYVVGLYYLKDE